MRASLSLMLLLVLLLPKDAEVAEKGSQKLYAYPQSENQEVIKEIKKA